MNVSTIYKLSYVPGMQQVIALGWIGKGLAELFQSILGKESFKRTGDTFKFAIGTMIPFVGTIVNHIALKRFNEPVLYTIKNQSQQKIINLTVQSRMKNESGYECPTDVSVLSISQSYPLFPNRVVQIRARDLQTIVGQTFGNLCRLFASNDAIKRAVMTNKDWSNDIVLRDLTDVEKKSTISSIVAVQ